MTEVKRQKRSSRGDRARATRRRIVDAGMDLFLRQGYAATTLEQVAAQAGVAVQTVYFHFGNKRTVLKEGVDIASVGDDEPVPVLDRPWMQQVRVERDPRVALALWMAASREIFSRVAPIMHVVRDAAGADPDMASQWAVNQQQRVLAHRVLAEQLADKGGLRAGLTVDRATDVVFALDSIEVYRLLTVERGWTPDEWEDWATSTIADTILR